MRRRRRSMLHNNEEKMGGRRRDEEDTQNSLVVKEGIIVKFPLPLVSFPCSFCFKVLSNKKKLNNHIGEIHKDPTS